MERLSEEKIRSLRETFKIIDSEKSGKVTYKELKSILERFDTNLDNSDISGLMQMPVSKHYGLIIYLLIRIYLCVCIIDVLTYG